MDTMQAYENAVTAIKTAILESQYDAARYVNQRQLRLYFGIGRYISLHSRNGTWGNGAIDTISKRLEQELPGLRGYSARNLRYMRTFYEEWSMLDSNQTCDPPALASAKLPEEQMLEIRHLQMPEHSDFPTEAFLNIGFTHHRYILETIKELDARLFYIRRCAQEHYSVEALKRSIREDDYRHQGALPNNFIQTLPVPQQAFRAVNAFKDEYLLDFINVEQLGIRDREDLDERVVEKGIIQNIKEFIMKFGQDFAFIGSQYHLEAFGKDQYIDLLFFNRALNCLVAVDLKSGPFKTAYLGQLSGYLSILDVYVRKPHENQSVGIVLCRNMDKSFVDFVIRDYDKPMGVATYKTSRDMPKTLKEALPDIDDLRHLLQDASQEV